jgi:hypothetical protein
VPEPAHDFERLVLGEESGLLEDEPEVVE